MAEIKSWAIEREEDPSIEPILFETYSGYFIYYPDTQKSVFQKTDKPTKFNKDWWKWGKYG